MMVVVVVVVVMEMEMPNLSKDMVVGVGIGVGVVKWSVPVHTLLLWPLHRDEIHGIHSCAATTARQCALAVH